MRIFLEYVLKRQANIKLILDKTPEVPYYLRFKIDNQTIRQPELSHFLYQKLEGNNFKLIDGVLWGKLVNIIKINSNKSKIF